MLTRGGLAGGKVFFVVTTNCKKSAEAIVAGNREGLNNHKSEVNGERKSV